MQKQQVYASTQTPTLVQKLNLPIEFKGKSNITKKNGKKAFRFFKPLCQTKIQAPPEIRLV